MHLATKKHPMIDLIVMRAAQRVICRDVKVMRGANCWTDYKKVQAKLRVQLPRTSGSKDKNSVLLAVHELSRNAKRDQTNTHSLENLQRITGQL